MLFATRQDLVVRFLVASIAVDPLATAGGWHRRGFMVASHKTHLRGMLIGNREDVRVVAGLCW